LWILANQSYGFFQTTRRQIRHIGSKQDDPRKSGRHQVFNHMLQALSQRRAALREQLMPEDGRTIHAKSIDWWRDRHPERHIGKRGHFGNQIVEKRQGHFPTAVNICQHWCESRLHAWIGRGTGQDRDNSGHWWPS
jgi:hypothetical protein